MKASKLFLSLSAVVAVLLATASPADALFRLRVQDVGAGIGAVITDNGVGDLNPAVDVILFSGSIGAFTVVTEIGLATPGVPVGGGVFFDAIDLNNTSVSSAAGGTLRIILEKDGFNVAPNGPNILVNAIGGTVNGPAGSSVTASAFANPGNLMPVLGADQLPGAIGAFPANPAGSVGTTLGPLFGTPPGGQFAASATSTFTKAGPYALFIVDTVVLTGAGTITYDHVAGTLVPAPAGLLLLAAGVPCFAIGYLRRRKVAAAA